MAKIWQIIGKFHNKIWQISGGTGCGAVSAIVVQFYTVVDFVLRQFSAVMASFASVIASLSGVMASF